MSSRRLPTGRFPSADPPADRTHPPGSAACRLPICLSTARRSAFVCSTAASESSAPHVRVPCGAFSFPHRVPGALRRILTPRPAFSAIAVHSSGSLSVLFRFRVRLSASAPGLLLGTAPFYNERKIFPIQSLNKPCSGRMLYLCRRCMAEEESDKRSFNHV